MYFFTRFSIDHGHGSALIALLVMCALMAHPVAADPPARAASGLTAEPQNVGELVDRITRDERGWRWALQDRVDRGVQLEDADFVRDLRRALGEVGESAPGASVVRATILIRLARMLDLSVAAPALQGALDGSKAAEDLIYEASRALAAVAPAPEGVVRLLNSHSDAVVAGAIDEVGDSDVPEVAAAIRRLVADAPARQGRRTGAALGELRLLLDYKHFWAAHENPAERAEFLLARVGEMFVLSLPPSPPAPVRSDSLAARWLRERLRALQAENPGLVAGRVRTLLESATVDHAYLLQAWSDAKK